jgi:hypothetical protein
LEEAPSALAEAPQVAALATAAIADLANGLSGETSISHDEAMEASRLAYTAAEAVKHHAVDEGSAGYREAAAAVADALNQVVDAALWALSAVQTSSQRLAVEKAAQDCLDVAANCKQPADPAPANMCTLLEIDHLVIWEEEVDGERRIHRLAVGDMTQLETVSRPDLQFETVFCDGSRGRRKRVPTLLKPQ